ncbi:MAG: 2-oxo acid dehydrogenase subunit E2 [Candidatus Omnitrophica bacterium]|nr:2-oxo acid dehydrogenase subunit E2 [Candidatus Omnitrophota bacterium]
MIQKIFIPQVNVNDQSATVVRWYVAESSFVNKGEALCLIETQKAASDIYADKSGYLRIVCPEGREVSTGMVIGYVSDSLEEVLLEENDGSLKNSQNNLASGRRATVKAQLLAKKFNIDLADVPADGVVKESDVYLFLEKKGSTRETCSSQEGTAMPAGVEQDLIGSVEPLSSIQKKVCSAVEESLRRNVGSYISVEVRVDKVLAVIKEYVSLKRKMVRLNDVIIKAAGLALKKFPLMNAFYWKGQIARYRSINIGIIMDYQGSLVAPVIKDVSEKTVEQIAVESGLLQMKALKNQFVPEDFAGGTFTVTNLSGLGVKHFMPIIYGYQSSILGVSAEHLSCVEDGPSTPRMGRVINLEMTYDHRLVNGIQAAVFLKEIKSFIETAEIEKEV